MITSFSTTRCRALGVVLIALVVTSSGLVAGTVPAVGAAPGDDAPAPGHDARAPYAIDAEALRVDAALLAHAERVAARDAFFVSTRTAKLSGTPAEVAVAVALEQIGKPYRTAAKGPDRFDCSGLTGFAWAAAGVDLPPSSRTQYASLPHVDLDDLLPGDLLFRGSPIHHVSMYIGEGILVHAPQSGEYVRVEEVDFSRVVGAARPWENSTGEKSQTERVAPTTSQRSPM